MKSKYVLLIIVVFVLVSCLRVTRLGTANNEAEESVGDCWEFVDSIEVFKIYKQAADSVVFYFMREEAPSVCAKTIFLLWKNGKVVTSDDLMFEIDEYAVIEDGYFFLVSSRNKTSITFELKITNEITCLSLRQLDLSDIPCLEIQSVRIGSLQNNNFTIKTIIEDDCFNSKVDTVLSYKLRMNSE